ncbi:50S ribosomal protein L17 [Chloroflexota bacterium]
MAGRHLSRSTDHRIAMYRNLVTDLLNYGKITTTAAKASEVRSIAEKMITLGKEDKIHSRRLAFAYIMDNKVTDKLFTELGPRYAQRAGGYTRTVKLGPRLGDAASMVILQLVD